MQRAVLAFANTLRKNGIRISVDEVLCALTGIELIDLASRAQFRTLLKTTWIKRADDIKEFDRLFELGARLEGGKWTYRGRPVQILALIRTEDELNITGSKLGKIKRPWLS